MKPTFKPRLNLDSAPVLSDFMQSDARVRIVKGPVGSGKTSACCMEIMRLALAQEPSPKDGIRYTRAGIIRNTYAELKTTTIKTWTSIFPEEHCGPVIYSAPIIHRITMPGSFDLEVLFVSCDRPKDIRKLLSLELSIIWFNEFREIEKAVFHAAMDRIPRFPSMRDHDIFATRDCAIADTNPPDEDHWLYDLELDSPEGYEFFNQPPAVLEANEIDFEHDENDLIRAGGQLYHVNPKAENLKNLKPGYYESKIPGKNRDWINVYYRTKYGYVSDGTPVIPTYNDALMAREDLPILTDRDLLIGIDIGGGTLSPAAIIGQRHKRGIWMILAEVVCEEMGLENFSREITFTLADLFGGRKIDRGWGDPSGQNRDPLFEVAILQHMRSKGVPVQPAPTNQIAARIEAITAPMGRFIDGQPGFLIHKRCKVLRAGLMGKWKFKKLQVVGSEKYHSVPDKNEYSHPADGLGYLLLGGGEHQVIRGRRAEPLKTQTRRAYKGHNVFAR